MHLDEIRRALQADCVVSGMKTKTHVFNLVSNLTWTTRHQKMTALTTNSRVSDLVTALWIYAGCPNKKMFEFLFHKRQTSSNQLRYNEKDMDQFETSFNIDVSKKDLLVNLRGGSCIWFRTDDDFPEMEITYLSNRNLIVPIVSTTGGSVETIVTRVLPMVSFYFDELKQRHNFNVHDRIMLNCKFVREKIAVIDDYEGWTDPTDGRPLYYKFNVDPCFTDQDELFSGMTINDLNEVFNDPMSIGGSTFVRRVLKPIVLAALVEHRGEDPKDLINQLQEGPTKDCLTHP